MTAYRDYLPLKIYGDAALHEATQQDGITEQLHDWSESAQYFPSTSTTASSVEAPPFITLCTNLRKHVWPLVTSTRTSNTGSLVEARPFITT